MILNDKVSFNLECEAPDVAASFVFKKLKLNIRHELNAAMSGSKDESAKLLMYDRYTKAVLENCISVDGLFSSDGSPVTAEQIRALDCDMDVADQIVKGFIAASNIDPKKSEEKKD